MMSIGMSSFLQVALLLAVHFENFLISFCSVSEQAATINTISEVSEPENRESDRVGEASVYEEVKGETGGAVRSQNGSTQQARVVTKRSSYIWMVILTVLMVALLMVGWILFVCFFGYYHHQFIDGYVKFIVVTTFSYCST